MTFDFNTIEIGQHPTEAYNALTDVVRDQLPPNHSEDDYRYAYAATIKAKFSEYKQTRWLLRFWFGQTAPLRDLAEADPVLFMDLVNHLGERLDELT